MKTVNPQPSETATCRGCPFGPDTLDGECPIQPFEALGEPPTQVYLDCGRFALQCQKAETGDGAALQSREGIDLLVELGLAE